MIPSWRTVSVPISRLREPPGPNPNVMSPEDYGILVANIKKKGCLQPVLARVLPGGMLPPEFADPKHPTPDEIELLSEWLLRDEPLEIIDGSHRVDACRVLGMGEIPVTVTSVDDAQAKALRVGMNRVRGELDLRTVGLFLAELEGAGPDVVSLSGYAGDELTDLLSAVTPSNAELDAMSALGGGDDAPPSEPHEDEEKTFPLSLRFRKKSDRNKVRDVLKEVGEGSAENGLLLVIVEAGYG